jgi:cobalamin biosynthesis protein CobC
MTLIHGGQLNKVAEQFNLDTDGWLDLSTGISPNVYPINDLLLKLDESIWRDLPQHNSQLFSIASNYYQTDNLMVTNGSQSVIQLLPHLWQRSTPNKTRVWLPQVGYQEHRKAWQQAGFNLCFYQQLPAIEKIKPHDIVIAINPNNPTTERIEQNLLLQLHQQINTNAGWLIVDEAFIDCYPKSASMMPHTNLDNLIVLRSFGKFFGLAGIRLGFVAANKKQLQLLQQHLGEWSVNGPAIAIAEQALADHAWHKQQQKILSKQSKALHCLLLKYFDSLKIDQSDLFIRVRTDAAQIIFEQLCRQKIYARLLDEKNAIRFGLAKINELARLERALDKVFKSSLSIIN